jgi:CO dehydrogenase/acetyl-CoA synthase beta subunit
MRFLRGNRNSEAWKNCANEKIKREFKKTVNEDVNEIVRTEPDTTDIDALVQTFREIQKGEEEEEEEEMENDIGIEEERCRVKT